MPTGPTSTSLSITNPLVLYRSLVASKKLRPDPAQHRLALHLQDLYLRLKDYDPEIEYRQRLDQVTRSISIPNVNVTEQRPNGSQSRLSALSSLFRDASATSTLSLTRTIPIQESALTIQSPQGLLLYGEVGRGKSMLLDLIYRSLPSSKKRRWHFNTFMLDVFRRLEKARIERLGIPGVGMEHVVLSLARESIATSPILFLDEFQLPDRASSKLLTSFMMSFFHLGGVLVASSNRMPDELAKAQGIEFAPAKTAGGAFLRWAKRKSEGEVTAYSDFGIFLEVLKTRCEVWEMEGTRDWRRENEQLGVTEYDGEADNLLEVTTDMQTESSLSTADLENSDNTPRSSDTPSHYHITTLDDSAWTETLNVLNPAQEWAPTSLKVYGRTIITPRASKNPSGIAMWSFSALCATNLGPADYVSIASTTHTLILSEVPVLTLLQKNEARRFITLLDALYEAKCRLLIQAAAPPDKLFFPETHGRPGEVSTSERSDEGDDSVYQESFSEIYQEQTAPFRPNVSSYTDGDTSATPSTSLLNPSRRSVLADEDADFGPTYGNGRGYGMSSGEDGMRELEKRQGPDFTQTSHLTGEDERFAYKRARSRLWEMCGDRWWKEREGGSPEEWWMPVERDGRFWESALGQNADLKPTAENLNTDGSHDGTQKQINSDVPGKDDGLFRHGASPFRTRTDAPPKFGWQHAWGMMTWGKKAGEWGKGVEGDRNGRRKEEEVQTRKSQ